MSRAGLVVARITIAREGRQKLHPTLAPSRCSFCSAGGGGRKRRRGKLPLPATKKDYIRSLQKKPEPTLELPSLDLKEIDFNKVGDTVESRLTQAQQYVYKFWRAEGSPRPERSSLNMDGRWWFWNIVLMATPGICIALYCEFMAKPEMIELLGKLDEEQRARILGEALEAEEEVFEMGEQDVQKLQESVNVDIASNGDEENLSLLTLKQRLDALESQLYKKDKQLDHLRRYQLERTQQSGVQNRIEDKMIAEWKSQGNVEAEETSDDGTSLTERMKEAVMHGLGENLETKKEALKSFGKEGLEYGRRLLSGEQEETPSSVPEGADNNNNVDKSNSNDDEVIKSVSDAASHANRAAEIVSASVSSNDDTNEMARAAKEASEAAIEAAQAAADAASQPPPKSNNGFIKRQWNKLFRRGGGSKEDTAAETPKP